MQLQSALLPSAAVPQTQPVTVLSIGDGDTLRVEDRGHTNTVRLACNDSPEMAHSQWGQQARQQLQAHADRPGRMRRGPGRRAHAHAGAPELRAAAQSTG